jgi:hypothetical protein
MRLPPVSQHPAIGYTSAHFPKFVFHQRTHPHELRKVMGTGKLMILVPLFDLKSLAGLAAYDAGTSDRRH